MERLARAATTEQLWELKGRLLQNKIIHQLPIEVEAKLLEFEKERKQNG